MKSHTWLPEIGDCYCEFFDFKLKSKRDYEASIAHKTPNYIKHTIGHIERRKIYYLSVYTKEV